MITRRDLAITLRGLGIEARYTLSKPKADGWQVLTIKNYPPQHGLSRWFEPAQVRVRFDPPCPCPACEIKRKCNL